MEVLFCLSRFAALPEVFYLFFKKKVDKVGKVDKEVSKLGKVNQPFKPPQRVTGSNLLKTKASVNLVNFVSLFRRKFIGHLLNFYIVYLYKGYKG